MSLQYQENYSQANELPYENSSKLNLQFPLNDPATKLPKGLAVQLDGSGNIRPAIANSFPIGHVAVSNITDSPVEEQSDYVTVRTVCADVVVGNAKGGAIATGALVEADGINGDGVRGDFITAATGKYAVGIVLSGGALNEDISVGLFLSPVLVP